ncbi:diaminopimelate decarboxylase [Mycobacterium botniense]|uniref:Diaminopimelate decarboxylase n=1 Tax=Mycobacterium botniense TaxID=84962 RepID=A0A7I9XYL7_9MYCO|nr:diaminopimelate decarboxylase [Mycobacterium botniense]
MDVLPSVGRAAPPRFDPLIWPITTHADEEGRLCIGEVPVTDIADQFRTPVYVLDETDFRYRARRYRKVLRGAEIVYSAAALLTIAVARWAREEGLGLAVCSAGELTTAIGGGVDPARIVMHGNARSVEELRAAVRVGVGRIVVDPDIEIAYLAGLAARRQRVLLRVTPGTDIHQQPEDVARVLAHHNLDLVGLHCHIGSQITDAARYGEPIRQMIAAMADIHARCGVILTELNIGGGHGIPYGSNDPELDLVQLGDVIDDTLDMACAAERFPRPVVVVEPGRGISGRAGVTLYRVCSVNTRPGGGTSVVVDGGMSDNPQAARYRAKCTAVLANRHSLGPKQQVSVAGRHCAAGDEIAHEIELPSDVHPGDLLAVACTGAYHHSMASNYTLVGRPPVVAVKDGRARELVRRETTADLLARDRG